MISLTASIESSFQMKIPEWGGKAAAQATSSLTMSQRTVATGMTAAPGEHLSFIMTLS